MRRVALAAALIAMGCGSSGEVLDPDVLSGSIVSSSRAEIVVAPDFADSATATVHGVDGVALGLRQGDRVRVRRLNAFVGKTDPLDWDCSAAWACETRAD